MKESWRSINWESIAVLSPYEQGTGAMQIARNMRDKPSELVRPACGKFILTYAIYRQPAQPHLR